MMSWFVPKEAKFFDMFREATTIMVAGAKELTVLIGDLKNVETRAQNIKDLEHKADQVTYTTIQALHATFITPMDRDDMYRLVGKMDDIMDYMDAASQRFHLYDITKVTPEIIELGTIIHQSTEKVALAVQGLENMKTSQKTLSYCVEINKLEHQADDVMRKGMAKLFRENLDYKEFIKLKEVLELLEAVTDRCKDVSAIVEGIVLDHA